MEPLSSDTLKTFVRGKWISITVAEIIEFLDIPIVEGTDDLLPNDSQVQINYDMTGRTLCSEDTPWPGGCILHGNLTKEHRFLNRFVCHNLEPSRHTYDVSHKSGYLLYCIGTGKQVNIPQVILNMLYKMLYAKRNSILPFVVFITKFLVWKEVLKKTNEPTQRIQNPINTHSLAQSFANIPPAVQGVEMEVEEAAPNANVQGEQQGNGDPVALLAE